MRHEYSLERDIKVTRGRLAYWRAQSVTAAADAPEKAVYARMIEIYEARLERLMKKAEAHEG